MKQLKENFNSNKIMCKHPVHENNKLTINFKVMGSYNSGIIVFYALLIKKKNEEITRFANSKSDDVRIDEWEWVLS